MSNILCIGAGYVGGPTMAMIAKNCPEHKITVVDINQERIDCWNSDDLPIYEPGLLDVVRLARGRNLFFQTDVAQAITDAEIIFVSVNTPTKMFGEGAGKAADLQFWEKTARDILDNCRKPNVIVVEKSTLPVRTAEAMAKIFQLGKSSTKFSVVSNPEFLAEGTAIEDLTNPDRVLIGGEQNEIGRKAAETVAELYAHWVPRENILLTNVWSSELSKLVANAMLAQRVSSINSISALCERTEADIEEVSKAIGMDTRIGAKFLEASIGFGGSCFSKDILHLSYLCEYYGLPEAADYWASVVHINEWQINRFFQKILHEQFDTLAGKTITMLGFAFKQDTGDTRDSPAIQLCKKLLGEHAKVRIHDPKALENARIDLKEMQGDVSFEEDVYKALEGAHVLALVTQWAEYRELDFERIYNKMVKPAFVFDGRNHLEHEKLFEIGFNVFPLGKAPLKQV
ncbi:MAG: nucleotide sugar dehydrogenase [bacterium]|tara:strand:- start:455 stop:1825 length:1371 start_codon:yes stop_codon:yes gene_type:complete